MFRAPPKYSDRENGGGVATMWREGLVGVAVDGWLAVVSLILLRCVSFRERGCGGEGAEGAG